MSRGVQGGGWPQIKDGIRLRPIRPIDQRSSWRRHTLYILPMLRSTHTLLGTAWGGRCSLTTGSVLAAGCSTG
jgi:hypothetical protein